MLSHQQYRICRNSKLTAAEMLLTTGSSLHTSGRDSEAPLRKAIKLGRVDWCRELISRGEEVNDTDCAGWSLLHEASNIGRMDIVELLLQSGASHLVNTPSIGGDTACHLAARCGFRLLVKVLVDVGADLEMQSRTGRDVRQEADVHGHKDTVALIDALRAAGEKSRKSK
ncbi:ankyrin repeat and SAM domain-containing protein 3-like [Corticium candelabrum]|uniref:ankyrin repeat and SAM domain-containing protein 3-like n=1 Tax=Corticium candelabrum TaxID=121492 RepID=UPI002E26030A|nr:ankyrin repeat and SAM domain-containing protein 3-like [Corticium candelabrum]